MKKIGFFIMIITVAMFLVSCTGGETGDITDTTESEAELALAECLTESGALFYGAYWCPHCIDQKEMFGEWVDFVPYVECEDEPETCSAAGITGYPTWIFGDGTVVQGAQSLETLAGYSGCEYTE